MGMIRILTTLLVPAIIMAAQARSSDPDIQRRLELIERGQAEAVKAELPALMTNYQNHAGVLYLQGVLTSDGSEAAKIYQSIVDNFPRSEWGDDALYKLYQYYYSIGLYKTADQKLERLRQDYPFSAYAAEHPASGTEEKVQEAPAIITKPGTIDRFATSFTVQVGAFSTLQNAEDLRAKFDREGYTSNIFTILTAGKKLHKVWVGEFQSYDEAKRFTAEIKKNFNLESIVVSR
jgi:tetratricopeptide (TPR) repeat protein